MPNKVKNLFCDVCVWSTSWAKIDLLSTIFIKTLFFTQLDGKMCITKQSIYLSSK